MVKMSTMKKRYINEIIKQYRGENVTQNQETKGLKQYLYTF